MRSIVQSLFVALIFATSPSCAPRATQERSVRSPTPTGVEACRSQPFDAAAVGRQTLAGTLMVQAGTAAGSGFLIRDGSEQLVVTNLHVVSAGTSHAAQWTMPDGSRRSSPLEVVRISRERDLALLRPTTAVDGTPLTLATEPPTIGQGVAAAGYPGVAGSPFVLTFEPGTITATQRSMATMDFIQTNANINPGNSGGPLLDGCGRVVGVVAARGTTVERLGLVIPARAVTELLTEYHTPLPEPKVAAAQQLQLLLTEAKFRRNDKAARYFTRHFVEHVAGESLKRLSQQADVKGKALLEELKKHKFAKWSDAEKGKYIQSHFSQEEQRALEISVAIQQNKLSFHDGAYRLLSQSAAQIFGNVDDLWIETTNMTPEGCAELYVTAVGDGATRRYLVHMHHEVGEWLVEFVTQMR